MCPLLQIVELSKKLRDQTAELEAERTRCKQWARKCMDMELEVSGRHIVAVDVVIAVIVVTLR